MASVDGGHMNCARCGRRLLSAAVLIATRSDPIAYGPKCAMRLGFIERRKPLSPKVVRRYMAKRQDQNQLELIP